MFTKHSLMFTEYSFKFIKHAKDQSRISVFAILIRISLNQTQNSFASENFYDNLNFHSSRVLRIQNINDC